MDYQDFIQRIYYRKYFAFSRWGDGEWKAMTGEKGSNCDGHQYFPSLGQALRNVLRSKPEYMLGMQPHAAREMSDEINDILSKVDFYPKFLNADVIHNENIKQGLFSLFEKLKKRNVVIVGNARMMKLKEYLPHFQHIIVPEKNAWLDYPLTSKILQNTADRCNDTVFLFASGMMSNVLIHDCCKINQRNFYIDIGSALDPYIGVKSRNYHHNLQIYV